MSIKTRMILAFSGIVLLTSILGLTLSYTTAKRYFIDQTRQDLMRMASIMARSVDGDVLRKLTVQDMASEAYQTQKDRFRRFKAAVPEARFIYFYRATDRPGVLELVMDGLEPGDADAISPVPEDRYYDAAAADSPRMIDGLTRPAADEELVTDQYGVWLSGYAPVLAEDGSIVGALGMDVPAQNIRQQQRQLLTLLALSAVASLAVALLAGFALAHSLARPVQELAEATHAIAGGDLGARVRVERSDEIGALGRDFNKMVQNLQAMASALQRYTAEALESHEENMALALQRVLLPSGDLDEHGVRVSASLRPVPWGGGDTYQHFLFGDGTYLMLSFGHVRASGLLACSVVTLVQSRLSQLVSNLVLRPAEILDELESALASAAPGLASMDYLCAVYDIGKHYLTVGSAGAVHVYLVRPATGELQRLDLAAPALGEQTGTRHADEDLDLEGADRLVVCSAYATQVQDAGGEAYGTERLEQALRRHAKLAPPELREALVADVVAFAAADERIEDDLTVLVAEFGADAEDEA